MSDAQIQHAIAELVPRGSRVLDLGCGDGAMLAHLQATRDCSGYGIEIDDANVLACVQRGVNVIQLNLDQGLAMFDDASFDVVLQIDTLQHLRNAEVMLRETVRVGRVGIVAFPNFAHWPNRLSVLGGRSCLAPTVHWFLRAHPDRRGCQHGCWVCRTTETAGAWSPAYGRQEH